MKETKKDAKKEAERVPVTLPRARGSEAKEVFVAVNGVEFLIPRGQTVEVPAWVAEELQRAEAAEIRMDLERDRLLHEAEKPQYR